MNAKSLIAQFDQIMDEPESVRKLRGLLRDVAVRGLLVAQEANDAPAAELLLAIADRESLDSHRKTHNESTSIDSEGTPFPLPPKWEWALFNRIARIESNLVDPGKYPDSPHVAPDNIESGTGRLLPYRTIRESKVTSGKHIFPAGVILYSKIRPALSKVVVVDFPGLCSADMYPIRPFVSREYLHLYMLSDVFVRQSTATDNRVAMPKINQASLSKILVAVPPLPEQERIVAKLSQLMTLCDQLETQLAKESSTRSHLLDAILHEAIKPLV